MKGIMIFQLTNKMVVHFSQNFKSLLSIRKHAGFSPSPTCIRERETLCSLDLVLNTFCRCAACRISCTKDCSHLFRILKNRMNRRKNKRIRSVRDIHFVSVP